MNLFSVPYPKTSIFSFVKIMALICLSVIFILTVLQPFGTASFQHEYKYPLLAGYGVVIFLVALLYYIFTDKIISFKTMDKWSVVHEISFLFSALILCLVGCYFYWGFAFGARMSTIQFFYFLLYAFSVAIFPVAAYMLFIYLKYKEVKMVGNDEPITTDTSIVLKGTNKKETVVLNPDDLLFVESNNNYVILNIVEEGKVVRKMIRSTLNNLQTQLSDNFLKCHRSFIVNKGKILKINGNVTNSKLTVNGSEYKIPVSRNRVDEIRGYLHK